MADTKVWTGAAPDRVKNPGKWKEYQEALSAMQAERLKPRANPPPHWHQSQASKMQEARKLLNNHERGMAVLSDEQIKECKTLLGEIPSGKVHVGSTRKRVPRRSGDGDAPKQSGSRRGSGEGGGTKRPPEKFPVLPKSDDS